MICSKICILKLIISMLDFCKKKKNSPFLFKIYFILKFHSYTSQKTGRNHHTTFIALRSKSITFSIFARSYFVWSHKQLALRQYIREFYMLSGYVSLRNSAAVKYLIFIYCRHVCQSHKRRQSNSINIELLRVKYCSATENTFFYVITVNASNIIVNIMCIFMFV